MCTKRCGLVVSARALYSEGFIFKSRSRNRLSWKVFRVLFPQSVQANAGIVTSLGHD